MLNILYNLLIAPIETLIQIIYYIMFKVFKDNNGFSIIAVSLTIQSLLLPIYRITDNLQAEERSMQEKMRRGVEHIKKTFKGDERFMMLSTYYRQNNYKAWYPLKSITSLLLQIPFFIAAYRYLSELSLLKGSPFLFISDLGAPDAISVIAGHTLNILPVAMTVINIISCIIYSKDTGIKDKIQVYGLALLFLVLLYNSPSGLVLYWTTNQIYSLFRNLIIKSNSKRKVALANKTTSQPRSNLTSFKLYSSTAAFLALFLGAVIPMNIINSSASDFYGTSTTPFSIIISNLSVYCGVFLIWGGLLFIISPAIIKKIMIISMSVFSLTGLANYIFFGNNFGIMTPLLVYEKGMKYDSKEKILNIGIAILIAVITIFLLIKFTKRFNNVFQVLVIATLVLCIITGVSIHAQMSTYAKSRETLANKDKKILHLSKHGRNVIVFMLDRAIDGYIPYIFDEKPELKTSFSGFTWYSNALSLGPVTNIASPSIYGGYEYTPAESDKRNNLTLREKHNEALTLLPELFSNEGFEVTVCDPPYANYKVPSDLTIYDKYDNVSAYLTTGVYSGNISSDLESSYAKTQQNAFKYFSLMRFCPIILHKYIYKDGFYLSEYQSGASIGKQFWDNYSVLLSLPGITEISDDAEDHFLELQNLTPHYPTLLRLPDYTPEAGLSIDNYGYDTPYSGENIKEYNGEILRLDTQEQAAHYQTHMAVIMALAKWFDLLKENDCWDNTRIILVADHGISLQQFDKMLFNNGLDVQRYNPLLLVKDFNETEIVYSDSFMTNADVPTLAVKDIISNPINPYTGKQINSDKKSEKQLVTSSFNIDISTNGYAFDTGDSTWWSVTPGDIFDNDNWAPLN